MKCDDVRELIPLDALGALEPHERDAVREHIASGCPSCAAEQAELRQTADLLPYALPGQQPSDLVRGRLMAAVRRHVAPEAAPASTPRSGVPAGRAGLFAAVAASALLAAAATALFLSSRQAEATRGLETIIASLREDVARRQEDLARLERQVRDARQSIQLVSSPGVLMVHLAGQGDRAGASARVFWDPKQESWRLFASNLAAAPQGRTYQLWLVPASGAPISAGVFSPDADVAAASGRLGLPEGARGMLFAVTEEPLGGSPQPTTTPFLVGTI